MSGEWRDLDALFVYASALKNAGLRRASQPICVVKVRQPPARWRLSYRPWHQCRHAHGYRRPANHGSAAAQTTGRSPGAIV